MKAAHLVLAASVYFGAVAAPLTAADLNARIDGSGYLVGGEVIMARASDAGRSTIFVIRDRESDVEKAVEVPNNAIATLRGDRAELQSIAVGMRVRVAYDLRMQRWIVEAR